jgi:hypothetical protein
MNKRKCGPLCYDNADMGKALEMLNDVWQYVRPGIKGLHKVENFVKGIHKLCKFYNLNWECRYIKVDKSTDPEAAVSFIESGISSDCPVAFLNLHKGVSTAFDGWHWIVLTGMHKCGETYIAQGVDDENMIEFDFIEWLKTTEIGGGLVYITTS